jgi:serine protease AprX
MARRAFLIIAALLLAAPTVLAADEWGSKLDRALRQRAREPRGSSRVIIQTAAGMPADALVHAVRGTPGPRLPLAGAQVADVPDAALESLARRPGVRAVSLDRRVHGTLERTAVSTGAAWVRDNLGFDGSGVGVALIDSGVTAWHDDLGSSRVVHFADFVNGLPQSYDDFGHGTHVAGIIAGNGYDSAGARRGIAPGAHLVALKVLDAVGGGYISNVIAALDYAVAIRRTFNIRVINLSVAAGVYESYETDPLTLAAKRAVDAGIAVVTAAGNAGRDGENRARYGGITAPGNAPWVLTVGAAHDMGTADRKDDTVAAFSSRGPTHLDGMAKPDLVAPGVGIESLAEPGSTLYTTRPGARLWGTVPTATPPYLRLSGTSQAAPVVSATVALMLQANPSLTPNAIKAILQYTAEANGRYNHLTQGAGFLNARGAVQLAREWTDAGPAAAFDGISELDSVAASDTGPPWSRRIIWGKQRLAGGVITPDANAWGTGVVWGAATGSAGERVTLGVTCAPGTPRDDERGCMTKAVWGLR